MKFEVKSREITIQDIASWLGLENPDTYSSLKHYSAELLLGSLISGITIKEIKTRRSGRSTRTVLRALAYMANHPGCAIAIVAPKYTITTILARQVAEHAKQLGLAGTIYARPGQAFNVNAIFQDHELP